MVVSSVKNGTIRLPRVEGSRVRGDSSQAVSIRILTTTPRKEEINFLDLLSSEGEEHAEDLPQGLLVNEDTKIPPVDKPADTNWYQQMLEAFPKLKEAGIPANVIDQLANITQKRPSVFAKESTDIGSTTAGEHTLELKENYEAFKELSRRYSAEDREEARKQVAKLLEHGVIEPSKSPFCSAFVMVGKKDGTRRMCIDYRRLNDLTIKDAYPLPRIDDCLDLLTSAKYFTALDLCSGYWQVPVRPEDRFKTAFAIDNELYQWKMMPFGLCNAVATFQRTMNNVLRKVKEKFPDKILCYIDDILIATSDLDSHLEILGALFEALEEANLKVKPTKCEFLRTKCHFLGRVIENGTIQPDREHVAKVLDWDQPRTVRQMQSFIGFCNYYREFVPRFSEVIEPLRRTMNICSKKLTW